MLDNDQPGDAEQDVSAAAQQDQHDSSGEVTADEQTSSAAPRRRRRAASRPAGSPPPLEAAFAAPATVTSFTGGCTRAAGCLRRDCSCAVPTTAGRSGAAAAT